MSTLRDLQVGQCAVVQTVGCARNVRRRLLEMGLLPGTELKVVRRAPMGDPVELRLRGYSLSIRGSDAASIEVELCAEEVAHRTDAPAGPETASASSSALSPAE